MIDNRPEIIFMGTPEFAVPSLKILLDNGYPVKAVVTAVDKPAGRGCKLMFSDIKKFALDNGLRILQPVKLKDPEFISELKKLNADLFIVVAFRMLPKEIWKLPPLGTFNLHSSLLPDYRGAAPINHAIINGETKTGVTTFFINEDIDTGNIIMQKEVDIADDDNAGTLHDKLMNEGAGLVLKTVQDITSGKILTTEQNCSNYDQLKYASKITKEFCKIDWNQTPEKIHNLIRGLSPYPVAFTTIKDNPKDTVKVYRSSYVLEDHRYRNGKVFSDNKTYIKVAVQKGFIFLEEIQLPGKKRLAVKDFLNGFKFPEEYYFS